ncbi:MAG TPA: hypothetical protein V6D12_13600 [Candidatus Obscuribacterales bacterium]
MKGFNERVANMTGRLADRTAASMHKALDVAIIQELGDRLADDAALSGEAQSLASFIASWRRQALAASSALIVGGFACLGLTAIISNPIPRFITANGAVACWFGARRQRQIALEAMPIVGIMARLQAARTAQELALFWDSKTVRQQAAIVEEPTATLPYSPELFDWGSFRSNPDQFPHLMILGKTGSGKSMLAEWLLSQLGGKVTAVTPHRSPKDWQGIKVVGGGRDFEAIAEFFTELAEEMGDRYRLYDVGKTDFEPWNIAIDEIPAILAAPQCGDVPTQLKELIREARKVKIRLVLLTQGAEVKALKVEGEGSIRDSLTFVRLGNFAVDHARKLKDEALLNLVKSQKRPCLVDDQPATVPNLGG